MYSNCIGGSIVKALLLVFKIVHFNTVRERQSVPYEKWWLLEVRVIWGKGWVLMPAAIWGYWFCLPLRIIYRFALLTGWKQRSISRGIWVHRCIHESCLFPLSYHPLHFVVNLDFSDLFVAKETRCFLSAAFILLRCFWSPDF